MKEYGVCYVRDRADIDQSLVRSRERVFDTTGVVHDPTMQVTTTQTGPSVHFSFSGKQGDVGYLFPAVQTDYDREEQL